MQCDLCGERAATVHLTEVVNKQSRELHLCEPCAREKGVKMDSPFGFAELLSGLADLETQPATTGAKVTACPQCGMRFEEFRKSGRLGCGACYEAFRRQLEPLLTRLHGAGRHAGRAPAATSAAAKRQADLEGLKARLRQAVRAEAFEEAARLRDQLRKLEEPKSAKGAGRVTRNRGAQ